MAADLMSKVLFDSLLTRPRSRPALNRFKLNSNTKQSQAPLPFDLSGLLGFWVRLTCRLVSRERPRASSLLFTPTRGGVWWRSQPRCGSVEYLSQSYLYHGRTMNGNYCQHMSVSQSGCTRVCSLSGVLLITLLA